MTTGILHHHDKPADRFTLLANAVVRDGRLSLRARGLLALLVSHANGWHVNATSLARECPEGRDAIRTAMAELATYGYLRHSYHQDARGHWHTTLEVYAGGDAPDPEPDQKRPHRSLKTRLRSDLGKQDVSAGHTGNGFPGVGKPGPNRRPETEDQSLEDVDGSGSSHLQVGKGAAPREEPERLPADLNAYMAQLERAWAMP